MLLQPRLFGKTSIFSFILLLLLALPAAALAFPTSSPSGSLLEVRAAMQATGSISGVVTDASTGQPLANIPVDAHFVGYGIGTCTDSLGQYVLDGLPVGVAFEASAGGDNRCGGASYAREDWEEVMPWDPPNWITLPAPGPGPSNIHFTLSPGGSVSGSVIDQTTGLAIEDITIDIQIDGYGMGKCTNADGSFSFDGIPLDVSFRVNSGGNGNWCSDKRYVQEYWQEKPYWHEATVLTLSAAAPSQTGINLTLAPAGTISGVVIDASTGQPLANIGVDVDQGGMGSCTSATGEYTLTVPLDTPFKIRAGGNNFCQGGPQTYLTEWWQEASSADAATPITATSGDPYVTSKDFTLDIGGMFSGVVTDQITGQPIADMAVNANTPGYGWSTCTDALGHYEFSGLPYNAPINAGSGGNNPCGSAVYVHENWQEEVYNHLADPIFLTPGQPGPTDIDFTLEPGGVVSGTVYEEDGTTRVPYANVGLNLPVGHCADEHGEFILYGVPLNTPFKIHASANGQSWCGVPNGHFAQEWYDNVADEAQATSITLTLAEPNRDGIVFTLAPAGTISGTVYADDGTTPLANMGVDIEQGGLGTCTDANGDYTLVVPRDTPYKIRAGGNNFCQGGPQIYLTEWWEEAASVDAATPITTTSAEPNVSGKNFTLEEGGSFSGVVLSAGAPLANAPVSVHFDGYGVGMCTDGNGQYTFNGLPFGVSFRVSAGGSNWCGGGLFAQQFYNGKQYWHEADLLTLTDGVPGPTDVDFSLIPGGSISGVIRNEQGVVQGGVPVDTQPGGYGTCSNDDGSYTLSGMPLNAAYKIRVGGVQWGGCPNQQFLQEFYQDVYYEQEATAIPLTDAEPEVTGIDMVLGTGGTISGHLTDGDTLLPAAFIHVEVVLVTPWGDAMGTGFSACSDSSGNYTVSVPYGSHKLTVGGSCDGSGTYYAWRGYPDVAYPAQIVDIVVSEAEPDVTGKDFTVYAAGHVHGTVLDATSGDPIPFISVQFFYPFTGLGLCTDEFGHYDATIDFMDVPFTIVAPSTVPSGGPGQWEGCANDAPYQFEYWEEKQDHSEATVVTFTVAQRDLTADFTLDMGGVVSGTVVDQNTGQPLVGVSISLDFNPLFHLGQGTCTDDDGNYEIRRVPLDIPFRVVAAGTDPYGNNGCGGPTNYVAELWQETPNFSEATLVTLTAGSPSADIDFTLEAGGSISGLVTDQTTGLPIPNIGVHLFDTSQSLEPYWICTDEDGEYRFPAVPFNVPFSVTAGGPNVGWCGNTDPYLEEAWEEHPVPGPQDLVTVTAAEPARPGINFTLELGGGISGQLFEADGVTPLTGWTGWLVVEVYTLGVYQQIASVEPAPDGSYSISGLAPGQYRVDVVGDHSGRMYYNNVFHLSDLAPVTVTAGATTPAINFTVSGAGTITGRVTDAAGNPLGSINVGFQDAWLGACTAADGTYTVQFVPLSTGARPLSFKFYAGGSSNWCGGSSEYTQEWWLESPSEANALAVSLTAATPNLTNANFTLSTGGTISGTVRDALGSPLANVGVETDQGYGQCTDEDGQYTLSVPFDTPLIVRAGAGGSDLCPGQTQLYAPEWWQDALDVATATPVTVTSAAPHATGKDFTLELGGSIEGVIAEPPAPAPEGATGPLAPGDPMPNISVRALFADLGLDISTCTGADGTYELPGLPFNQPFIVRAGGDLDCGGENTVWALYGGGLSITLTPEEPVETNVNFLLDEGGTISGVVRDAQTNAVLPRIAVMRLSDNMETVCTDAFGAYQFPGVKFSIPQSIRAGGSAPCTGGSPHYETEWWQESDMLGATQVVINAESPDLNGIDFTLAGIAQGEMTVALQGHGAAPNPAWVTSLHIVITRQSDATVLFDDTVTTDETGGFTISGLPTGEVNIRVKGSHTLAVNVPAVLYAGINLVAVGPLPEGDANDDNNVNIADFSILAAAFATMEGQPAYDERADFNDDGVVNISDFSLLAQNFGQSGAQP